MRNLLRAQAGRYVAEGSLAPSVVVETGFVNNVFEAYTPPQATGGTVTYVNEHFVGTMVNMVVLAVLVDWVSVLVK